MSNSVDVGGRDDAREFNPIADSVLDEAPNLGGVSAADITIDGKKFSYDIYSIHLIQPIDNHHEAKVAIRELGQESKDKEFSDSIKYTDFLGKSISITIEAEIISEPQPVKYNFVGIVTKVDLKNSISGLNIGVITAHSPSIAMDGARQNAFFMDQKASDIIGTIIRNYPITVGNTEDTKGQLKYSVQYRETDYDFVMRMATREGLYAYYNGKEFCVEKANQKNSVELEWRISLGAFEFGLGTASAEYKSAVYNYEQKKIFEQDSSSLPLESSISGMSKKSTDASKEVYSNTGFSESPTSIEDAQSLDRVLQSRRNEAISKMILCKGACSHPSVAVGTCVKIKGMDKIDGAYWVTKSHHIFTLGSYLNKFECIPVDIASPKSRSARANVTNLQTAEVVDNNDPDKMGRIKVKFPWNAADETIWVRVAVAHAGADRGWYSVPEIGDEVLVGYEYGNADLPIVIGSLYNKDNAPLGETIADENCIKSFITKSGNKIMINDTDGSEEISIVCKDGTQVVLNAADPSVSIETTGDVKIKAANIELKADSKITLDGGEIEIKSGGNIKEEAGMNMETKAGIEYKIEGTMVTVKGTPIQLN